jgi:hypothetical protein
MIFCPGLARIHGRVNCLIHGVFSIAFRFATPSVPSKQNLTAFDLQTTVNPNGTSVTTLWRAVRTNKEDRVAKLEWAPNGGLGRAVIGKVNYLLAAFLRQFFSCFAKQNTVPMADLVRADARSYVRRFS